MPDTEAARADMRMIFQYIDAYVATNDPDRLKRAWQYVNSAREKDPTATLLLKEQDKVITTTIDSLEATILTNEGQHSLIREHPSNPAVLFKNFKALLL